MLFSSNIFIFVFLPIVLAGFAFFRWVFPKGAFLWLTAASLVFYGYWRVELVGLIIFSILVNFALFQAIIRWRKRAALVGGVIFNLGLLGYFKYYAFILGELKLAGLSDITPPDIILPIGISFFTFQQIALLVDAWRKEGPESLPIGPYALFVTFFPQLIAGPIVHHKEMMPQFERKRRAGAWGRHLSFGLALFTIGLAKKVLIADPLGAFAAPVFDTPGAAPHFIEAWMAALAYTFQIYFDFSGYSDMACGLALMFGVRLPANFFSPYKATSIVDFWRRWHMTLSRFLRDYIYVAFGGNRKGRTRRYVNLFATMILGGIWHGAGWTFLLWGALHGAYLTINHIWSAAPKHVRRLLPATASWALTFLAVIVAWVLFRAPTLESAMAVYEGMIGGHGVLAPLEARKIAGMLGMADLFPAEALFAHNNRSFFYETAGMIVLAAFLAFRAPNSLELLRAGRPTVDHQSLPFPKEQTNWARWFFEDLQAKPGRAFLIGMLLAVVLWRLNAAPVGEFLYFQF